MAWPAPWIDEPMDPGGPWHPGLQPGGPWHRHARGLYISDLGSPSPSQILGTTSRNLRDPSPSQILLSTFSTFYFLWSKFQTFCNGVTPGTLGVDIIESQDWGPPGGLSREYEPPSPVYRCASRSARSRHCTAPSYLTLPRHPGAGTVSGKVVAIAPPPAVLQSSHTPPRCIVTSTRGGNTRKKTIFPPIFRTFLGLSRSLAKIILVPCR